MEQNAWDSDLHPISIYGSIEYIVSDIKNIKTSLCWMSNYILNKKVNKDKVNNFENLKDIDKKAWNFISAIYNAEWNMLIADSNNISFRNKVAAKFTLKITLPNALKNNNVKDDDKPASINKLLPLILAKIPKKINEIIKFFKKNSQSKKKTRNKLKRKTKLYTQTLNSLINNTREVLKIKEIFFNLQTNKIENIQKIIKENSKPRSKINIVMKEPLRKQIIVLINNDNSSKFLSESSTYISNINGTLKNIKSDVKADFVWAEQTGIVIVTNKVTFISDLQTVESYIKNINYIEANNIEFSQLLQSKLYLKIIEIPYLIENTNTPLFTDVVKTIIKNNYIFNNIIITSRLKIIKLLPKSDMAIIWLDIWDLQSGSKAKGLINRCFNIGNYITMI